MTEAQVKRVLNAVGIGSSVIIFGLVIVGGFYIYKNILETKKLTLEIDLLKKDLDVT